MSYVASIAKPTAAPWGSSFCVFGIAAWGDKNVFDRRSRAYAREPSRFNLLHVCSGLAFHFQAIEAEVGPRARDPPTLPTRSRNQGRPKTATQQTPYLPTPAQNCLIATPISSAPRPKTATSQPPYPQPRSQKLPHNNLHILKPVALKLRHNAVHQFS